MKFKLALCQMKGSMEKEISKAQAEHMIKNAVTKGADMVSLPEMWNCPYDNNYFRVYAEKEDGDAVKFMSNMAKSNNIYLVGGSIPENEDGKIYNTSFIFNRKGEMIGKHRKAHLFDIDVKDGIRFIESETLTPGEKATVIETEFGKIGVAICYDVRFPELFRKMTLEGVKLVILPAAFNMTTGPAHWDLSMRARALDNQIYFAACAPARDYKGSYVAYGHSVIVDPWGQILNTADENEAVVCGIINTNYVDSIREQLPLLKHRRPELY